MAEIPERRVVTFNEDAVWTPQEKKANLWLCALILCVVGAPSLVVASVSTIFNAMFAYSLGMTFNEKMAWVAASLGFSLFVIGIPIARPLIRQKRPDLDAKAFMLWVGCVAFSITSALGFSTATREQAVARIESVNTDRTRTEQEIARVEHEIDALPPHRPVAMLAAAVDRLLGANPIMSRYTDQCRVIETNASRNFCSSVLAFREELASAKAAERLEARLTELLAVIKDKPVQSKISDPQADVLDWLSGRRIGEGTMRKALSVAIALLVEAGAAIGLSVAAEAFVTVLLDRDNRGYSTGASAPSGLRIEIEPDVQSLGAPARDATFGLWADRCVSFKLGGRVSASSAFDSYENWCAMNGMPSLPLQTFGKRMSEFVTTLGGRLAKSSIRYYDGIAIVEHRAHEALLFDNSAS